MATIEDLVVGIGVDTGDLDKDVDRAASSFKTSMGKITLASAAVGAGLEGFARSQQDTNIQVNELAASLGITSGQMRDLAADTANVGFPLQEVLDIMETGKQQGLKSKKALTDYATFWDMIGDASGESAVTLAEAGVALHTMGIAVGQENEALAALGFIHDKTTISVQDFLNLLGRVGPDLKKTGIDVNETAALLGILGNEMGLTGRAARTELMSALKSSDGTQKGLLKTLGISEKQFKDYTTAVADSGDVMQRNSDIVDQQFTVMQKLQNEAHELMFRYGDLVNVAGMLAPVFLGLGPAIKGFSVAMTAAKWASVQLGVAMDFLAANPIIIIIAAIVAVVAALVLLYMHCEGFRKVVDTVVHAVAGFFVWLWKNVLVPVGKGIAAIVTWLWSNIIKPYFELIGKIIGWVVNRIRISVAVWKAVFQLIGAAVKDFWQNKIVKPFLAIVAFIGSIPAKIRKGMSTLASVITAPFRSAFNGVARLWNNTIGQLHVTIPDWVPGIGGKSWSAPTLPTFHKGGEVGGGPMGAEVLGVLRVGERITPRGESGGGELTLRSGGGKFNDAVVEAVAEAIRRKGPRAIGLRVAGATR